MKVNLNERVAVVTGGAHGIGRAIVQALSENGAHIVIVDIDAEAGEKAANEIIEGGGACMSLAGDVSDAKQMEAVAEQVMDRLGRINILINNAGINTRSDRVPIHQYSLEDWNRIVQVDLTGVFVTSRAIIPEILKNPDGGRIVNTSSIAGLVPLRLQSAYVAAKAGCCQPDEVNGDRARFRGDSCQRGCAGIYLDSWDGGVVLWSRWRVYRERCELVIAHPTGSAG